MNPTRPLLRYHGGKWILAPWIISYFPQHKIYVEPFGGAASVLLRKSRSYAEVYNDLDKDIVNLFRVMRDPDLSSELIRMLRLTPFARQEFEEAYSPAESLTEQARRTIIRSFMGFGSVGANGRLTGFRNNSNRSGTIPAHDWRNFADSIKFIIDRLQGVVIENKLAIDLIQQLDNEEAFFYCDPPYMHDTRYNGAVENTYNHEMTDKDHAQLAKILNNISGMAIISGYDNELYDDLYSDWHKEHKSSYADGARTRIETLWIKPNTVIKPSLFSLGEIS